MKKNFKIILRDSNNNKINNNDKQYLHFLINNFFEESLNKGCFCYFLKINYKCFKSSNNNVAADSLNDLFCTVNEWEDIAFYIISLEYDQSTALYTDNIYIFIAIDNLIGNNVRISTNIASALLENKKFKINIKECKLLITRVKIFKHMIKEVFTNTSAIATTFIVNKH